MEIPIKMAAKKLQIAEETLREGLRQGAFPFGTAFKIKDSSYWKYVIYPKKFEEYVGNIN